MRPAARDLPKAVVYGLLLLNFGIYLLQDWQAVRAVPPADALAWLSAFATSLDDLCWLVLLGLYELESAWVTPAKRHAPILVWMRGVRGICYAGILATLLAYVLDVIHLYTLPDFAGPELCELAGQGWLYLYNESWTPIGPGNCAGLAVAPPLYQVDVGVVTDGAGLAVARLQAWLSVAESVVWLVIMGLIEFMLLLRARDASRGWWPRLAGWISMGCYGLVLAMAGYWAWMGHLLYLWDDLLWIGGFLAIEWNLARSASAGACPPPGAGR